MVAERTELARLEGTLLCSSEGDTCCFPAETDIEECFPAVLLATSIGGGVD